MYVRKNGSTKDINIFLVAYKKIHFSLKGAVAQQREGEIH